MTRLLVLADEVDESLTHTRLRNSAPDLVIGCGDLPFDYLEEIIDVCNVPLYYVPGNHDPALRGWGGADRIRPPYLDAASGDPPGVRGGTNIDGKVITDKGVTMCGLGGSIRYRPGANQYTQAQMRRRALLLLWKARARRATVDVLVTHAPSKGVGDEEDDRAHTGFDAFHFLLDSLRPAHHVHGHVHPYGRVLEDLRVGTTVVSNVIPHRTIDLTAVPSEAPR